MIKVPPEFRNEYGRMHPTFMLDDNGDTRPQFRELGFDIVVERPGEMDRFLHFLFPNRIVTTGLKGKEEAEDFEAFDREFNEWMKANTTGCWAMWITRDTRRENNYNSTVPVYYFENAADAMHFKLRWQ